MSRYRSPRCGWCAAGDHEDCQVLVVSVRKVGRKKWAADVPWRCGCLCEFAEQLICGLCRRSGVDLHQGRCVDESDCFEVASTLAERVGPRFVEGARWQ